MEEGEWRTGRKRLHRSGQEAWIPVALLPFPCARDCLILLLLHMATAHRRVNDSGDDSGGRSWQDARSRQPRVCPREGRPREDRYFRSLSVQAQYER